MTNIRKTIFTALFSLLSFAAFGQQDTERIAELIFKKTNQLRQAKGLVPFKELDILYSYFIL